MNFVTSYSNIRKNLKSSFEKVIKDHEPLLVERRNGGNVVIISQDDYESLEETAYLFRSPKMAKRLLEAKKRKTGKTLEYVKKDLRI